MDGKEQNWLLIRKRDGTAEAAARRSGLQPMLATPAEQLPRGDDWLFEVKWDGYRALAVRPRRRVPARLAERQRPDRALRAGRAAVVKAVKTPNAVLDGEVCALDEQGRPSFSSLQAGAGRLVYYAFDVLEADGEQLVDAAARGAPGATARLLDRRSATVRCRGRSTTARRCSQAAEQQGLEGVMAKRPDSPYRAGRRTRDWLKVKTAGRQEFVDRRLHARRGPARGNASARSCWP